MRLSADLIARSPTFVNPVKDREIDLRGNKISVIENLGVTQDLYDCIDLSDNEIKKIEGFPFLRRLSTLFLHNNRINRISPNLDESLPNLRTLILTNNKLSKFSDIEPLADLPTLTTVSLMDNPVSKKINYRLYVIHLLPNLRVLDFRKVKQKERTEAVRTFGEVKRVKKVLTGEQAEAVPAASEFSKEQVSAIKNAIEKTSTIEGIYRLETALLAGQVPGT